MYYTVIKHDGHLRTRGKCRKHEPQLVSNDGYCLLEPKTRKVWIFGKKLRTRTALFKKRATAHRVHACSLQAVCFHTRQRQTLQLLFVSDTGRKLHNWHFFWKYTSSGTIVHPGWGRWKSGTFAPIFVNSAHRQFLQDGSWLLRRHSCERSDGNLHLLRTQSCQHGVRVDLLGLSYTSRGKCWTTRCVGGQAEYRHELRPKHLAFGDLLEVWLAYVLCSLCRPSSGP